MVRIRITVGDWLSKKGERKMNESKAEMRLIMRICKTNDPDLMMKMLDHIFKEKQK